MADPGLAGHREVRDAEHEDEERDGERGQGAGERQDARGTDETECSDHHRPLTTTVEVTADEDRGQSRRLAYAEHRRELGRGGSEGPFECGEEWGDPTQRHVGDGLRRGQAGKGSAVDTVALGDDVGSVSRHGANGPNVDRKSSP